MNSLDKPHNLIGLQLLGSLYLYIPFALLISPETPVFSTISVLLYLMVIAAVACFTGCYHQKRFFSSKETVMNEERAVLLLDSNRFFQFTVPVVGVWWYKHPPRLYRELQKKLVADGYLGV